MSTDNRYNQYTTGILYVPGMILWEYSESTRTATATGI